MIMSKTDLEQLVRDARAKGLNQTEIEHMKRHYYSGILDYAQNHTEGRNSQEARTEHADMTAWHGYVRAATYIRQTIDAIQRGEKK